MKKKVGNIIFTMIFMGTLVGCGQKHEHDWQAATCTEPLTCSICGEISGGPLGHTWKDAACEKPMTCAVCGETNGEALGHRWTEATCEVPSTCEVCGATEGDLAEHTLDVESGQCVVCGKQMIIELTLDNYSTYLSTSYYKNSDGQFVFTIKANGDYKFVDSEGNASDPSVSYLAYFYKVEDDYEQLWHNCPITRLSQGSWTTEYDLRYKRLEYCELYEVNGYVLAE